MNAALTVLAVVIVAGAVRALTETLPPLRRPARAEPSSGAVATGDRERLDRVVSTATTHAGDLHLRLRPILREIAADGLRRRGVELDAQPEAAQQLLAPDTWEIVRPDRPRPGDAFAPGAGAQAPGRRPRRPRGAAAMTDPHPRHVAAPAEAILDEVERAVVGKREVLELVLLAPAGRRPRPARGRARRGQDADRALVRRRDGAALRPRAVHARPDALRRDRLVGLRPARRELRVPARARVLPTSLLGDEINRAPPKTQSALLEAMEERQVTVDGGTHPLPAPFLVIATQNPIEYEGTYPLPEAQLDRFLMRLGVGYPTAGDEWSMLDARARRGTDAVTLRAIIDRAGLLRLQAAVEAVHVGAAVGRYMVALATATRESSEVEVGASPRGSLALLRLARARAAMEGRDFVVPDDVKAIAVPALAHRLVLRPELWVRRVAAADVVRRLLDTVPAPPATEPQDDERARVTDAR